MKVKAVESKIPDVKKGAVSVQSHPETPHTIVRPTRSSNSQNPKQPPAPSKKNGKKR